MSHVEYWLYGLFCGLLFGIPVGAVIEWCDPKNRRLRADAKVKETFE